METAKIESVQSDELMKDLMPKKFGKQGRLWLALLLVVIVIGAFAWYRQLRQGLVVTDMRDYTSWGIYISNFVFFCCYKLSRFSGERHSETYQCQLEKLHS
jgi:molybdopterin-containing oxidoreductase family membrane subunit